MPILHPGDDRQGHRGFSLLELIIVLILMGLAAALVAPSITTGFKSLELETAGRDLITEMKYARSEAIGKQKVFRIVLSQTPEGAAAYSLTDDYGEPIRKIDLPAEIGYDVGEEVTLPVTISFYPNGRSSAADFLMKSKQKRMRIVLDPITGFARVENNEEDDGR